MKKKQVVEKKQRCRTLTEETFQVIKTLYKNLWADKVASGTTTLRQACIALAHTITDANGVAYSAQTIETVINEDCWEAHVKMKQGLKEKLEKKRKETTPFPKPRPNDPISTLNLAEANIYHLSENSGQLRLLRMEICQLKEELSKIRSLFLDIFNKKDVDMDKDGNVLICENQVCCK
jgi:hypothetical protein